MTDEYSNLPDKAVLIETFRQIRDTSVGIQLIQPDGEIPHCSGVHIGNGLILTVQHALTPNETPERIIINHGNAQWSADIIEREPGLDLLLLKMNQFNGDLNSANVREGHKFRRGEAFLYYPYHPIQKPFVGKYVTEEGMTVTDSSELKSDPYHIYPQHQFIMGTVNRLLPGNSGTGVFTPLGELVGIIRGGALGLNEKREPAFPLGICVSLTALKELRR